MRECSCKTTRFHAKEENRRRGSPGRAASRSSRDKPSFPPSLPLFSQPCPEPPLCRFLQAQEAPAPPHPQRRTDGIFPVPFQVRTLSLSRNTIFARTLAPFSEKSYDGHGEKFFAFFVCFSGAYTPKRSDIPLWKATVRVNLCIAALRTVLRTDAARTHSFPVRRRRIGKGILSPPVHCGLFAAPPFLRSPIQFHQSHIETAVRLLRSGTFCLCFPEGERKRGEPS